MACVALWDVFGLLGLHAIDARKLWGVSKTTVKDIAKFMAVPDSKLECVYNGIDHEQFKPASESEKLRVIEKFGLGNVFFFYLARIEHPGKNHSLLIKAFEEMVQASGDREVQLVCAGSDWHGAEVVHAHVAASPVVSKLRCLVLLKMLTSQPVILLPELPYSPRSTRALDSPVIESLACGTPVISSDAGSLAEIGGDHVKRCDARDAKAWSQAMADLIEASKPENAAATAYASQFNWKACAAEMAAIYRKVA